MGKFVPAPAYMHVDTQFVPSHEDANKSDLTTNKSWYLTNKTILQQNKMNASLTAVWKSLLLKRLLYFGSSFYRLVGVRAHEISKNFWKVCEKFTKGGHIGSVAHFVDVGVTRNVKGCQKQQSGRPTHFVDQHICWCGLCSVTAQFVVSVLRSDTICWCGGVFRINKWCHEEGQKQHSAQTTHFVGAFEKQKTQWVCFQNQHHSDLPNFHCTNQ